MTRPTAATILLGLMMSACTPQPNGPPAAAPANGQPAEGTVVGTVRVVGSLPVSTQVVVQEAGGRSVVVDGALAEEIARLAGAEVAVSGRTDGRTIEASGYEIRAVDGRPAILGTVERIEAGVLHLRTEYGELVQVHGPTEPFRVGQKIWVQGLMSVRMQSYGVVR